MIDPTGAARGEARHFIRRLGRFGSAALLAVSVTLSSSLLHAAEIRVMNSGGFSAAYKALLADFEKSTGHTLKTAWGPSMGTTENAIPVRLARGEKADVLIMVGSALDEMARRGAVVDGSKTKLANSPIGMAVKAGAPRPDISTVEAFKHALLAAKTIAYSDSASGVYIEKEMLPKLGIADAMKGKARMIPATPVAEIVAQGEAELGFQQVSELLPVHGIDYVGLIPPEVQKITTFSAGITTNAAEPEAARALIRYLSSATAADTIRKTGLEPLSATQ
ncbi:MAG: substrate-binding domain-containing protein [Xanthobacteraceae bacterium]|nr:substrate-binding domain-containing protein [Xanthobacteraceae bacterium]MBY0611654.1 substrate-binding domain-containing protein [Beijerinckiaceae bacterium]